MRKTERTVRNAVVRIRRYHSPYGDLMLGSLDGRLCLCDWIVEGHRDKVDKRLRKYLCAGYEEGTSEVLRQACQELDEYFLKRRTAFDVPLLLPGTDFQRKVWAKLLEIPYGKTVSYAELSRMLGTPGAVRAVANANGANAVSIFVPCHRVIGSDRSLTGYGGGLAAKKMLLELEADSACPVFG